MVRLFWSASQPIQSAVETRDVASREKGRNDVTEYDRSAGNEAVGFSGFGGHLLFVPEAGGGGGPESARRRRSRTAAPGDGAAGVVGQLTALGFTDVEQVV